MNPTRRAFLRTSTLLAAGSALATRWARQPARADDQADGWDLAVIGGGSAGFGAALAAARHGCKVLLVEKADCLGGTSTRGGVNGWEPVAGATGIPFDLCKRMRTIPLAAGIYSFGRHLSWYKPQQEKYRFPGGEMVIDPGRHYADTLQRAGGSGEAWSREHMHGVAFEPDAMARTMKALLEETRQVRIELNIAFVRAHARDGRIEWIELAGGRRVSARCYIDATGDGWVCASAGCEMLAGQEARETFGEPHAPPKATGLVNGVSLLYRAARRDPAGVDEPPQPVPAKCWWRDGFPIAHMIHYPCGDWNINMLPTMDGQEFVQLSYDKALAECRRRVLAHWRNLQTHYDEFRSFGLGWIAPALGIRESRRVRGECMLTELDLLAGLGGQKHPDIICLADHPMDTHGSRAGGLAQVRQPYGVPFRCLIPKGFANLLVAGRCAGLSSLAASSCRLSRTMMQLGQAAGTAAALARHARSPLPAVPADKLRNALAGDHVQLELPMPPALRDHLTKET